MTTEKEILVKLDVVEKEIKSTRGKIDVLRTTLWEQESELLMVKLAREKLIVELKEFRENAYDPEDQSRTEEIKRFREVLPELMKRKEKKEK